MDFYITQLEAQGLSRSGVKRKKEEGRTPAPRGPGSCFGPGTGTKIGYGYQDRVRVPRPGTGTKTGYGYQDRVRAPCGRRYRRVLRTTRTWTGLPVPAWERGLLLLIRAAMCSGSEAGSYLRRIDFVYHSTLGLRVIKKKKKIGAAGEP